MKGVSSELMTFAMSYALLIVIIVSVAITSGSILIHVQRKYYLKSVRRKHEDIVKLKIHHTTILARRQGAVID